MKPMGVWAAAGLVLATILGQALALTVLGWMHVGDGFSDSARFALADWLGTGAVLLLALHARGLRLRPLLHGSALPPTRLLLWLLPPLVLVMPGVLGLDALLSDLADRFTGDWAWEQQALEMFKDRSTADAVAACLIAPLLEELLFRGLILYGFAQRYGRVRALWWSALLFSAAHANVHQFLGTLPFGLLAGALVLGSGSLWPAIVAHALFNAGALLLPDNTGDAWLIPAALAGVAGGWWLRAALRALR